MIEIQHETLVPVSEIPKILPPRSNGKHIHISAVYRWIQKGVRGTRLEAVRIGGRTYSTFEALQRFCVQTSEPDGRVAEPIRVSPRRQRQVDEAERRVRRLLEG